MAALIFVVDSLFSLVVWAFMLRVLLPLCRADSRNPLSQAIINITSPLVLPLRRALPAAGRFDTGAWVALILVQLVALSVSWLLRGQPLAATSLLISTGFALVTGVLRFYFFALLVYALMSWVAPGTYSPASSILSSLCAPVVRPFQRLIPPIGGLDLSVVFAMITIQALLILLGNF